MQHDKAVGSPAPRWIIALDAGGSSVKSGVVLLGGETEAMALEVEPIDSRADAGAIIATLIAVIRRRLDDLPPHAVPDGVVLALPGPFDYERGVRPPDDHPSDSKYRSLTGIDLSVALGGAIDAAAPIRFVNDAEAAALGEANFGAGRPYGVVLMITLGSGLGSALVDHGRIRRTANAIEIGRLYASPIGGGATADDVFSHRGLVDRVGRVGVGLTDLERLDRPSVGGAEEFSVDLGIFLRPVVSAAAVEVIVIGGGVAGLIAPEIRLVGDAAGVAAVGARLGDAAGVVGAALVHV